MIDTENIKAGTEIWFMHQNRAASFTSLGINKRYVGDGLHVSVIGRDYDVPVHECYLSEMELIEDQINYWRDMRLNKIVKDNL